MATKKPTTTTKKPAAKKTAVKRPAVTQPLASMARNRSILVANEIAAGKRNYPEEQHTELPASATPLDVLLMAMRRAYLVGGSLLAADYAEKAAPYVHGKISSIELKNPIASGNAGNGQPGQVPFKVVFVDPPAPKSE